MSGPAYPAEIVAAMGGHEPTQEQWRAISMPLEPSVIVAGAGSGKTSVMAARVVYLALVAFGRLPADHDGVAPGSVLCVTFTNKAMANLALRVRRALATLELPEGEEPEVLNYHGFAARILEQHGLLAGIEPGPRILSPAQRIELCARVLDEMTFEHVKAEWQPTVIEKILDLADQAANHRVEPGRIIEHVESELPRLGKAASKIPEEVAHERIELAQAVRRFQQMKAELRVMDFGDQITRALTVVEQHPEVVQEYRARYGAVLLDEYQDTNIAQADMMAALFGDGFPVTAVGDPDQNIYAWRGASLYNLIDFPKRFRRADGSESGCLPLYTNFRSGERILAAADTIIGKIPPKLRPAEDKKLEWFPPNGQGEVHLVKHLDEWAEATWIAQRILEVHDAGEPWDEIAVLCRKSRLFVPLRQALADRRIPAEFVGLVGLLKLPEVVEILAYARAVADPSANVALARILLGPRYRVGFKDLARLGGWAAGRSKKWREILGDEADGTVSLAEALEHLAEVEGLSDDARERLERFRDELTELRVAARRPVGEFLGEVIRRIGLLGELDAHLDAELASATRRNLAAFLDEVHAFSPIEGELTLRAFVDYVDAVDSLEKQEWSPVQPSEADSVKVMTVHQAKGLEFGTVFVPGFAKDLLPDYRVQQNPATKGKSLDFELRGDREILPTFAGNLKGFWDELREQELYEERRTCYVALTRAKQRLTATGAHWYGDGGAPKDASIFLDELFDWGTRSGDAEVDPGPVELGPENPLVGYRERFVRDWPEPARPDDADELFPSGWRTAAIQAADAGGVPEPMLAGLDAEQRAAFEPLAAERRTLAAHLVERETTAAWTPSPPTMVSVSSVVEYGRCPKRFFWTAVRPLPRFSGPAARIGTEIHAWIERQAAGQATLLELDEAPDVAPEELVGEPGRIERLQQAFLDSRFGSLVPLHVERPFLLAIEGFVVRGRIDAIFDAGQGRWEVVDYKTGSKPPDDPLTQAQLDLYALACIDVWGKRPEDLTLTYAYLASGDEVSHVVGDLADLRERVSTWLRGISSSAFEPTPSPHCRWCDFRPFCDTGQRWLAENPA